MQNKRDRQKLWNAQVGGAEEKTTCVGCLTRLIYFDRYKGWEASHVWAGSNGGNIELYNMFALCNVCNGQMRQQNMFCYFMELENLRALRVLIHYVCKIVRLHYPLLWAECSGQMYHLARLLYVEKTAGDGGIPASHPVVRFFLKEDIAAVDMERAALAAQYREKHALSLELHDLYDTLYARKKRKRPSVTLPVLMQREMYK